MGFTCTSNNINKVVVVNGVMSMFYGNHNDGKKERQNLIDKHT